VRFCEHLLLPNRSSLVFILIIIFVKYLATKNIFKRVWENKVKRDEFERLVIESNSLGKNSWVKQYGLFLVIPILVISIVTGSELFLAIYLCTFSVYLINSFYISYRALKTQIPQRLLPEPSKVNEVYEMENERRRRYKTPIQLQFEEEFSKMKEEIKQLRELSIIATTSEDVHLSEKAKSVLRDLELENEIKRSESVTQKPAVDKKEGLPYMD
jgi:hypothetical protein